MKPKALVVFFVLTLSGCLQTLNDIDQKNLCDENALCAEKFTCVCFNEKKICVENNALNDEMIRADKTTVCKAACTNCFDAEVDAEPDAEEDGGQDVSSDSESDAGEDIPCISSTEICDGLDNDCDKEIDEELPDCCEPDKTKECGSAVGECQKGLSTCQQNRTWGACENEVGPSSEICDGKDNNCNNKTDEDYNNLNQACSAGIGECLTEGIFVCNEDHLSTVCNAVKGQEFPEECDGLDNDCDNETDEDVPDCCKPSDTQECGSDVGECQKGLSTCQENRSWGSCENEIGPSVDLCDTLDNNCDGNADEDFVNLNTACQIGQGECLSSGIYVCSEDKFTTYCNATIIQPIDEICDLLDNDCDNEVDEDLPECCKPEDKVECGSDIGECQIGLKTCLAPGVWSECDGEVEPVDEICDSKDNNCNNEIDETYANLGHECQIGVGECLSFGQMVCGLDFQTVICNASQIFGTDEICDNKDNDCDNATDEDVVRECGSDVGECQKGVESCSAGQWLACEGEIKPADEICDGKDNNCDNETDEGYAHLGDECQIGIGECLSHGQMVCGLDFQTVVCDAEKKFGTDEVCDNRDNDCDNAIDEDLLRPCGSDVGECQKGIQACSAGEWLTCEGEIQPTDEICDGLDNNCDIAIDEGFNVGNQCFEGLGECKVEGVIVCKEDHTSACNAIAGDEADETCDGLDNDCDDQTDEGLVGCCEPDAVTECGIDTGECAKGTSTCQDDRTWGWCVDSIGPVNEICDGLDNDCDNQKDNGLVNCCSPGISQDCGTDQGECSHGHQICWQNRQWGPCENIVEPVDEICDTLDNDCDGTPDNGFNLTNDPLNCGSCNYVCGNQGTSSSKCVNSECQLTCTRFHLDVNDDPTDGCECTVTNCGVEICDSIDNDCDGAIDENRDSLVMYLSFDNTFNDISPNANNATNHGATFTQDSVCGQAASFDGVDDYAEVADSVSMDSIANEFTICVSANVIDYERGDVVFSKFRLQPAFGIEWNEVTTVNNWTFFLNRVKLAQGRTININQWITLCGKFQQGMFTAYINGEQIWQGNAQNPVGGITYIGSTDMPLAKNSHMKIDEMVFYNKALSDAEIQHYFEIMKR